MSVLAIDQGTSATKAVVVDPEGGIRTIAEVEVRPSFLDGGGVEVDPASLLASVLDAGRRALDLTSDPIEAVALANQGETVLAWDPNSGAPLSPAIVWQDRRAEPLCAARSEHAAWVAERTGLVLDPYFSAPKMAWLRAEGVDGGIVTTTDAWLLHHLTGELVTDVTTASRSLIFDLDDGAWSGALLELFGLDGEVLPRIVACDEVVGHTGAFGGDLPVAGLAVDQQAALLAEGCTGPGEAKCTFGTGAFVLANTGERPVRSTAGLSTSVAWQVRGRTAYCIDGQVYTAASAVRWLCDVGLLGSPEDLDQVAAADAGGVRSVPSFAGLGAPWWRPDATATFVGITLSTGRGQLVRAVLEGIAAQVAEVCASVGTDVGWRLAALRVDGGLTRSSALLQAVADLTQLAVEVYPSPHATALGAAALARLALDGSIELGDAVPPWTPVATYVPRWSADRAAVHLDAWRSVVATALDAASST